MWCPEGYVTMRAVSRAASRLAWSVVVNPHAKNRPLSDPIPPEATNFAFALERWLIENMLWQDWWGAISPDGSFVRLDLTHLLLGSDYDIRFFANLGHRYNPLTTIGPPSPEWLKQYGDSWDAHQYAIDVSTGIIGTGHRSRWKALKIKLDAFISGGPLIARKTQQLVENFGGYAICLRQTDLEQWVADTEEYLSAFLGTPIDTNAAGPDSGAELSPPRPGPGRRPTERQAAAAAILARYGPNPERVKGWKETTREISAHMGRSVSEQTLRRAFDDLREKS
jgi:hypothetical protein